MSNPLEQGDEFFISAGIKANRNRQFEVSQSGKFWYELLKELEGKACESHSFPEVMKCTLRAVEIRAQLKRQGF